MYFVKLCSEVLIGGMIRDTVYSRHLHQGSRTGDIMQLLTKDVLIHKGYAYCRDCYADRADTTNTPEAIYRAFTFMDDDETVYCAACNTDLSRAAVR